LGSRGPQALFRADLGPAALVAQGPSLARAAGDFTPLLILALASEEPHTLNFGASGRRH
jgi:hypothetical protein